MKQKTSKLSKFYFWLFVTFGIMAAFLFWSARGDSFINRRNGGINISLLGAVISTAFSIMFGLFTFVRFIRSRSVAGGLFLTTAISTCVFLGSSQIVAAVIPATAAGFAGGTEANTGFAAVVGLAQIGLFALWFCFLLLTIYLHVKPVKKIDHILAKIIDGESIKRVKIGKSKQYKGIAKKLEIISSESNARKLKEIETKKRKLEQRLRARARAEERKLKKAETDKRLLEQIESA